MWDNPIPMEYTNSEHCMAEIDPIKVNETESFSPEWSLSFKNKMSSDKFNPEIYTPQNVTQLSVYVPVNPGLCEEKQTTNKKVLVNFHPGNLVSGSDSFSGRKPAQMLSSMILRDNETIIVNVRYSLGPLGLWHFDEIPHMDGTDYSPNKNGQKSSRFSNQLIHEAIVSLLWVQRYISKFGGDQNKVIISGASAGSSIAHIVDLVLTKRWFDYYKFES